MKVGILTHPLETNYGGLLQAYALQTVIRRMGHDVYTIDRHNKGARSNLPRHILGLIKRYFRRYVQRNPNVSTSWNAYLTMKEKDILGKNTWKFVQKNIKITNRVWSHELKDIDEKYQFDAYVVGSDQIWLPNYCPNSFLDFVKRDNVIKCSYAASCSCASWSPELTDACRPLARSFKGLSVREIDLIEFCRKEFGCAAQHVLDPTLLLDKEDYLTVVDKNIKGDDIIFSYILDDTQEKRSLVEKVSKHYGVGVAWVNAERPYYKRNDVNINECIFPSVDNWINNLNNAKFVITDSFHGMAMSIVFKKPFIVIANKKRGLSRFESMLGLFGLESRLILNVNDFTEEHLLAINYDNVYDIIKSKRKESIEFLNTMLSK